MLLVVAEDRQAEAALRRIVAAARAGATPFVVLTADALLMMQLQREGIDARLPIDTFTPGAASAARIEEADRIAFAGVTAALGSYAAFDNTDFAPYLEYTLAPSFVRAVRNVTAVQDVAASISASRLTLVGGGALVRAANVVASQRSLAVERVEGGPLTRALHAVARLRAGRATRWVNTEFRALVLEPGFLTLLFTRAFWRRIAGGTSPPVAHDALIVVGDRFTRDVFERLSADGRQIVLAGATQPGRALFDGTPSVVPLEQFGEFGDLLSTVGIMLGAIGRALSLLNDRQHARQFTVGDVNYWPLVCETSALHIAVWVQRLRRLQTLAGRAAAAAPRARLLTSVDVTAYTRMLIDTVRRRGISSVGIQHGITAEPNGHSMVHVDTLAAWGEQAEEWYRFEAAKRGRQQTARFVVTGNPRYDQLAARVRKPRDGSRPFTVCVCTGFLTDFSVGASEYENLLMIDTVLEWARRHPGVRVIHKIHPGEELEYYRTAGRVLGWSDSQLTTTAEPVLHDLLEDSDLLVGGYSSTVLESIALGTPAIVFDAVTRRQMVNTPRYPLGGVPGVHIACSVAETLDLLDAIREGRPVDRDRLRSSPELQAFVSQLDGRAAERVADVIRSPSPAP